MSIEPPKPQLFLGQLVADGKPRAVNAKQIPHTSNNGYVVFLYLEENYFDSIAVPSRQIADPPILKIPNSRGQNGRRSTGERISNIIAPPRLKY
eukprot:scaffold5373_cov269-Chaetoceros_neogracile.AAC.14